MPFLEILTRHYMRRPGMLAANQESLDAQTCDDWIQTLLIDEVGRGVEWANVQMGRYAPRLIGDYVWILDDDDVCICNTFVEGLKKIVTRHDPDVVMVKADHKRFGILPDAEHWGQAPEFVHVGMSCFVLRRAVWQRHARMLTAQLGADYRMIRSIFETGMYKIHWWDCVAMRVQRISYGAAE